MRTSSSKAPTENSLPFCKAFTAVRAVVLCSGVSAMSKAMQWSLGPELIAQESHQQLASHTQQQVIFLTEH